MNRKQRRTLSALKRKGQEVALPKEDEIKQKYFHKCATLGELVFNLARQEEAKHSLFGDIEELMKQFTAAQEEAKNASKTADSKSEEPKS
jgi:hypothetical protein